MIERDVFSENVKRLRKERGWTHEELADASGLHPDHVKKIEKGQREPKVRTIAKLARGFGLSLGPLFEGIDGASEQR